MATSSNGPAAPCPSSAIAMQATTAITPASTMTGPRLPT